MNSIPTFPSSPCPTAQRNSMSTLRLILATARVLGLLLGASLTSPRTQAAVQYQTLKSFGSIPDDGASPFSALVEGTDGALYGTTSRGGSGTPPLFGRGMVFRLDEDGSGYSVLYNFGSSAPDGSYPAATLVEGTDGVLYGTTYYGGASETNQFVNGLGTVFKLNKDGSGYSVVYSFGSSVGDGFSPQAGLLEGSDGALYGTAGPVFKLNKDGSAYTVLHRFTPSGSSGLVEGSDGVLYGTTASGGESNKG